MNISYARYSSHLSRDNSIEDQHRINIRKYEDLGIPESQVTLIEDRAIPGTHEQRPGYQQMMAAVEAGQVEIIIVDDQSRLTRAPDIGMLLEKFRFHNVRFIAVADGVDTAQEGTEVNAEVKGLVNNLSNKGHAKRTRRGLAGRAESTCGAAGDHPYGYSTTWEDPEAGENYNGHGPRPKKIVMVDPEQSRIVEWVFHMFTAPLYSLTRIAHELNKAKAPLGRRSKSKTGWSPVRVQKMLMNRKYIGEWKWGANKVVKHNGKKRYFPANPGAAIYTSRPNLAIVEQKVFETAQQRLKRFQEATGKRNKHGKKRFYGVNLRETPTNLLSGLLHCGGCDIRLRFYQSKTSAFFKCPSYNHGSLCTSRSVVSLKGGEEALLEFLHSRLAASGQWLDEIYNLVVEKVKSAVDKVPERRASLLTRREDLQKKAENLTANLSERVSKTLQQRLSECEDEMEEVDKQLGELDRQDKSVLTLPTRDEVARELADLWPLFREDPVQGAVLLRKMIGKIKVFEEIFPGKKRGYARLEFDFDPVKFLRVVNHGEAASLVSSMPEKIVLYTGQPTKLERLMPQIHEWVLQGVGFKEIGRRTGMSVCGTTMYYKRWLAALAIANPDSGQTTHDNIPDAEVPDPINKDEAGDTDIV